MSPSHTGVGDALRWNAGLACANVFRTSSSQILPDQVQPQARGISPAYQVSWFRVPLLRNRSQETVVRDIERGFQKSRRNSVTPLYAILDEVDQNPENIATWIRSGTHLFDGGEEGRNLISLWSYGMAFSESQIGLPSQNTRSYGISRYIWNKVLASPDRIPYEQLDCTVRTSAKVFGRMDRSIMKFKHATLTKHPSQKMTEGEEDRKTAREMRGGRNMYPEGMGIGVRNVVGKSGENIMLEETMTVRGRMHRRGAQQMQDNVRAAVQGVARGAQFVCWPGRWANGMEKGEKKKTLRRRENNGWKAVRSTGRESVCAWEERTGGEPRDMGEQNHLQDEFGWYPNFIPYEIFNCSMKTKAMLG
ncbi:hypothetical protein B0H14DRAFT_3729598 [Mycena olivaceomarginata]|nr:hypothetical protein B0H14DRAFT_3729598 [Mycena olivaceomarginata]